MDVRKISRPPFFFLAIILVATCIISAVFFLHPLIEGELPVGGSGSQILGNETIAGNETGSSRPVTIISVSGKSGSDIVYVTGTTTLPENSGILFEIWPADIAVRKTNATEVNGFSGPATVSTNTGTVVWSAEFDTGTWNAGEYIIRAWPEHSDPRYGDRKVFFLPLNETIRHGAGTYSRNGEILLTPLSPSETPGILVSVTPLPTPG